MKKFLLLYLTACSFAVADNVSVSSHAGTSDIHEVGESFKSDRLVLLDEINGNLLFRGNFPEKDGKFCYDDLVKHMQECATKEKKSFPEKFTLIDLSFLNYIKNDSEIDLEKDWCKDNEHISEFWLTPLYGATIDPLDVSTKIRHFTIEHHDIDGLKDLTKKVNDKLRHSAASSVIIYMHCMAGKDRTGEMSAAYMMQYKGWSYKKAVEWDKKIAKRYPLTHFMHGIRWYAFYLRDFEHIQTIGAIEK